jgi:translation initiation factor IF-2
MPPPTDSKGGERKRNFGTDVRKPTPKEFREHKPSSKKMEERSFDARDRQGLRANDDEAWRKRRPSHKMRHISSQEEVIRPKVLHVKIPITIKDLASEMKLKASQLISKLFMKGVVATINDFLDDETTVQLLGHDFECEITIDRAEETRLRITDRTIKQEIADTPEDLLVLRPPVVTFMGHVDHGKTSLIDAIRTSDIAAGEAGDITQHIGAFKCRTASGDITILDTPGHEAFSAMRARGADVTDIVVLVIAGDEGMRTQTIEAMEQAKTAQVPIVVALNKCDKPNFNPDNVYRQLSEHELLPEAWGGQTITINCSAVTKQGLPELLEMLALQAEVLELKANPEFRARGTVIESEMHKGMGAVATILVQNGTLRLGDALVFSHEFAKIKTMQDEHGKTLEEAGPSTPVKITGLSGLPAAGSEFIVVKNEKEAMEIAEKRSEGHRHTLLHQAKRGLESMLAEKAAVKKKVLNLILRADVQGSVEALKTSLLKIASDKVELNILSSAVGEISESDVQLASASKAVLIGFHTKIESHAESLIKSLSVTVRLHDIIYHAVDDVRALMLALLDKVAKENDIGKAEVKAIFKASQLGIIAGCMVTDGIIKRSCHLRQVRNGEVIWRGPIQSLKKVKEDVKEASKGHECGIVLSNQSDIKVGDILEAFEITYLQQEL